MNDSVSPSRLLQLIGGVGMIVSSFLEWLGAGGGSLNGWDTGMLGLWQTIIGAIIAGIGLAGLAGKSDSFPDEVFGFDFEQAIVLLAFPPLLWNFGLQFDDLFGGLGLFLGWITAAIAIAGAELERRTFRSAAA